MLLQYIFVIYVHVCMHQSEVYELWIVRVIEAGSNIAYVAMTQIYSRAVMQAVYTRYNIILLLLCFLLLSLSFNSTTSTVTILHTCPIYYA